MEWAIVVSNVALVPVAIVGVGSPITLGIYQLLLLLRASGNEGGYYYYYY